MIASLKSLQQLYYIEADEVDNIRTVTEIGKLLHLRVLGITKLKREDAKEFCSSLENLRELRELNVYSSNEEEIIDLQYLTSSSDLPRLQTLHLIGRLEKCPQWISCLHGLTRIKLRFSKLSDDPLECLQDLRNLITLNLTSAYQGESLCFKAGGFPRLENLRLISLQELRWVTVEENAIPFLQELRMCDCQSMEDIPTGIGNLKHLQNLDFSEMPKEFVNKLEILDNESAAYRRILQIPRVVISIYTDGKWSVARHLDKETWTFKP